MTHSFHSQAASHALLITPKTEQARKRVQESARHEARVKSAREKDARKARDKTRAEKFAHFLRSRVCCALAFLRSGFARARFAGAY